MTSTDFYQTDEDPAAVPAAFEAGEKVTTAAPTPSRRDKLLATHYKRIDAIFANKTFDIVEEIHLPRGQAFKTCLGNRGRHGYVLRDRATGEKYIVGAKILQHIAKHLMAVSIKPRSIRYLGREPHHQPGYRK